MSATCPCGSRLKLQDCCVSKDIAVLKREAVVDLASPEKIDRAITYIKYKANHNKRIIAEQKIYAESIGKEITCKKGCSACCAQFIAARLEECDAIVIYLYLYPELMNRFLKKYDDWHEKITSGDNILKKISRTYQKVLKTSLPEDKKRFELLALEYARKHALCPFLNNDECIIYPVRPYTCSTYTIISDKKYCDPNLPEEEYIKNKLKIKPDKNPLYCETEYFAGFKKRFTLGPLQTLVYHILKGNHEK